MRWLSENQDAWVELTMVTEDFLRAEQRKRLNSAHPGIVNIVPQLKSTGSGHEDRREDIDLTKSTEELFSDFFKSASGQRPNEQLIELFREIRDFDDRED